MDGVVSPLPGYYRPSLTGRRDMKPLTILHVVHQFFPHHRHGTELVTLELAREQQKRGHNVCIVAGEIGRFHSEVQIKSDRYEGIPLYRAFFNPRVENGFLAHEGLGRAFGEILTEVKPDLVHIQHLKRLSLSIIDSATTMDIPVVMTLQDYSLICAREMLIRGDGTPCHESDLVSDCSNCLEQSVEISRQYRVMAFLHAIRSNLSRWRSYRLALTKAAGLLSSTPPPIRLREREDFEMRNRKVCDHLKRVDLLVAPGESVKNRFLSSMDIPPEKITVLPQMVDTSLCCFTRRRVERGKVRFGFIGKIARLKGVHLAIEAFRRLPADMVELHLFGAPTWTDIPEISYYLETRDKGRAPNITFHTRGFPREEIARVFDTFDMLIVPSICFESFGRVVVEAFASGVPVISSDAGGPSEMITEGENGFKFRTGDADALYEVMQRVVDSPEIIESLSSTLEQPLWLTDLPDRYEKAYRDLL